MPLRPRPGYAFLITILLIGALSTSLVVTVLLLSTSWSKDVITVRDGAQALALARSCAERTIVRLREDPGYAGNEDLTVNDHSCHVGTVGGTGTTNRTICTSGAIGDSVRRIEISLSAILPSVLITSWEEVPSFTLCTGA
jgi:hypothetical protein